MALKRFIRYLYEYEEHQKKRNVGFVKVEQQADETAISIHGKDLCGKGNEKISCYLIKQNERTEKITLLLVGEIQLGMTFCGGNFCYKEEDVCGLGLGRPEGPFYLALWDEEKYDKFDLPKVLTEPEEKDVDENILELQEVFEKDNEKQPELQKTDRRIMKIQRGEISILPRCEWKLANNNFLLHGYYNYRHLVLIDEGDRLKLGVPGIYHEREAKAAETFGFPEFIGETDVNVTLEPQERNVEQQFGYWCRQVRRPPR